MANSMTLSQGMAPASYGQPAYFNLAILNGSGGTLTVSSINVWATNSQGMPTTACRISPVYVPVNGTLQVNDGSTMNVPVSASFFGFAVVGTPNAAPERFLLTAEVDFTNGTSVTMPTPLSVQLADPIWGQPGSPPNAAAVVSSLAFSTPANSGLHLLGWV